MTALDSSAAAFQAQIDLVKRIIAGERAAENELVSRYSDCVSMIVKRIVKDRFVSDDVCQDTFRLVLEKIRRGDLRDPARLSGFVCSLARNLSIEHLRSKPQTESLEDTESRKTVADSRPDQLSLILEEEEANAIGRMLRELKSERDRAVLYRFYIAEEDKERICADLGLSSLQFNTVLHRARERFRELYEERTKK